MFIPIQAQATTKLVFSINTGLVNKLKERIPARRRSELIEELLTKYFIHEDQAAGWKALNELRQTYNKEQDSVTASAVEWLRQDRQSH